jgi:ABC-2 type transport system permease protein
MNTQRAAYFRVFATFARNSLVRNMMFRANFIIEGLTSISWMVMQLGFYALLFSYSGSLGENTGWGKYEFFVFLSTTLFVNSLVETFFMSNAEEFSELVRTGGLDFAMLKPIDTQFLISCTKVDWSSLSNFLFAFVLLVYSLAHLDYTPHLVHFILYPIYVVCGVLMLYSLMISLAATSVWLGRNQSLYEFWFYITNFSRYPMEIYRGPWGTPLRNVFTWLIPILIVVNVPARFLAKPLDAQNWWLALFAILATIVSLLASRWMFLRSLDAYRSASS